jgi:hypothetical protein
MYSRMDYTFFTPYTLLENMSYKFLGSRQAKAYLVPSSDHIFKFLAHLHIPHIIHTLKHKIWPQDAE